MLAAAGLRVDHVDSHQHLHLWPPVGRIVTGLARSFGNSGNPDTPIEQTVPTRNRRHSTRARGYDARVDEAAWLIRGPRRVSTIPDTCTQVD